MIKTNHQTIGSFPLNQNQKKASKSNGFHFGRLPPASQRRAVENNPHEIPLLNVEQDEVFGTPSTQGEITHTSVTKKEDMGRRRWRFLSPGIGKSFESSPEQASAKPQKPSSWQPATHW